MKKQIHIPGDKSISHRAVMLGALANGETVINGFLASADCLATIKCFQQLGIQVTRIQETSYKIIGKGLRGLQKADGVLDVGNSGTTIRLLSGILAGQNFTSEITGDASIQKRPMKRIFEPLTLMGARIVGKVRDNNIYAPLKITGTKLKGITYELPVASAQVKSAVMLAGLFAEGETTVVEKIKSRDHTERMFRYFAATKNGFPGKVVDVPGDISSAAFFMVLGLITPNSELTIYNVGLNPTRTGIIDVLRQMGGKIEIKDEQILSEEPRGTIVIKTSKLKGIKIDGAIIPRIIDEIPIIAVAATQAKGKTEIRGARELRVKESDRIATIASELRKMGAKIEELEDGLIIEGPTKLHGAAIDSHGDHRIAMACSIAAKVADGETKINDVDCIETSFPGFSTLI
ncbi:MAG: 3-phosphoshikimate 1-carboxyvinyltransferase [bacterium]